MLIAGSEIEGRVDPEDHDAEQEPVNVNVETTDMERTGPEADQSNNAG